MKLSIIFLIPFYLFSNDILVKEKNKVKDNIVTEQLLLKTSTDDKSSLIKISSTIKKNPVFNISFSPFVPLEKNIYIRYQFIDLIFGNTISTTFHYTDQTNFLQYFPINRKKPLDDNSFKTDSIVKNISPDVWSSKTINTAVSSLYGLINTYKTDVIVKQDIPSMVFSKFHILSDINLKSISVFSDTNEYSALAIIQLFNHISLVDYRFSIRTPKTGTLVFIAQDFYGSFYRYTYSITNAICISDGEIQTTLIIK